MKKISSVILAVLLAFSSIFCVNTALADENAPTLTKELKLNGAWSEEYDSKITNEATWFKFHIDYQGKFKLQMKTYDALDVKLYNSELSKTYFTTVIKEFNDTKTKTKSESVVLNPGDYYVRVVANGKYALNASFGLNSYVNPEAAEIGKVYSGLSTDDDGSYWYKIDLKNKGKYTLSLTSSGIATAEVYNSDMSKSLDVIYIFSSSDLAKTSTKDIDLDKGTYLVKVVSTKEYRFSFSNYVCNHIYDVTTTAPTYFADGYNTYVCAKCGYSYKTKGEPKKILKTPKIYSLKGGKKKITVSNSNNKSATGYQIKVSTSKKFTKKTTKTVKVTSSKTTVKKLKKSKKYYVKVRAYKTKNSKTVYSNWSKVKSIKTK